jgi:NADP-dependent 3-hydroxy acid dehydrogenase YdfG
MAPSFESKIVLITGAGSGIGRGARIKLAKLGATLALTDIKGASLSTRHATYAQMRITTTLQPSMLDQQRSSEYISVIISNYNRIGHIFNCAGINGVYQSTVNVPDVYRDKIFNTNAKGFLKITLNCIPYVKSGASFLNPRPAFGISPGASFAVYCALKLRLVDSQ